MFFWLFIQALVDILRNPMSFILGAIGDFVFDVDDRYGERINALKRHVKK